MALMKCLECQGLVSSEATACPHCGAPVKSKAKAPAIAAPGLPAKSSTNGNGLGLAVILIAVVLFVFKMCSTSNLSDAPQTAAAPSKTEACIKGDLTCAGEKGIVAAGVYCQDGIEKLAKHAVKWTDESIFTMKFSRYRWTDKEAGTVTFVGDKVQFQNGFGAFTPVVYECDLAADLRTVVDVRVREGRLP